MLQTRFNTKKVQELMEKRKKNLLSLSEEIGVSYQWMSTIIGRGYWKYGKIAKLAEALGVTVEEITD